MLIIDLAIGGKALECIDGMVVRGNVIDSLKYLSTRMEIVGDGESAREIRDSYEEYISAADKYNSKLMSNGLLGAESKQNILAEAEDTERALSRTAMISILILVMMAIALTFIFLRSRIMRKRLVDAKKKKTIAVASAETLRKEYAIIAKERDTLRRMFEENGLAKGWAKDIISNRIGILNGMLAKEITDVSSYSTEYENLKESAKNNKSVFLETLRDTVRASKPRFAEIIDHKGLDDLEKNYFCLLAMGLRGKEAGNYLGIASQYNISSAIRKNIIPEGDSRNLKNIIKEIWNS